MTHDITLSPTLRAALRAFAGWIDGTSGPPRARAVQVRATIRPLLAAERSQLARWLAWLCKATASQGRSDLQERLRKLDRRLHAEVAAAGLLLPTTAASWSNTLRGNVTDQRVA